MQVLHVLGKPNNASINIDILRTIHSTAMGYAIEFEHMNKDNAKSNNVHIKHTKMTMQFGKHKNGVTIKHEPHNKLFVTPTASSPNATAKHVDKKNFIKGNKRKPLMEKQSKNDAIETTCFDTTNIKTIVKNKLSWSAYHVMSAIIIIIINMMKNNASAS